jgi:hypothetical protein
MVEWNDRVLIVARTGAGKSELLNVLFSELRNQRLLVDPKDEFAIEGVERIGVVDRLDFAEQQTLHYVPAPDTGADDWEQLFERCYRQRHLTVVVHEAAYTVGFSPNRAGPWHNSFLAQGRAHGLGAWYATTRPVKNPTYITSEPGHVFAFAERMARVDDHRALAESMDMDPTELADEQRKLLAEHGKHGFLWANRSTGEVRAMPPMPESVRAMSIVQRRSVA